MRKSSIEYGHKQVGRYASDRTREALDQATLRLAKAGRKPPPPENGCVIDASLMDVWVAV